MRGSLESNATTSHKVGTDAAFPISGSEPIRTILPERLTKRKHAVEVNPDRGVRLLLGWIFSRRVLRGATPDRKSHPSIKMHTPSDMITKAMAADQRGKKRGEPPAGERVARRRFGDLQSRNEGDRRSVVQALNIGGASRWHGSGGRGTSQRPSLTPHGRGFP
jgi:hypothetical protein